MVPELTHSLSGCTVWVPLAQRYLIPEGSERPVEAGTKRLGSITSQRADKADRPEARRALFWDGIGVRVAM